MADEGLLCWNCGRATGITGRVMRSHSCENCLADLRCCHGCRQFQPGRRFQCMEPIETNVVNKEKNNFCDFFQKRDATKKPGGMGAASGSKDDLKKRFDNLFDD